MKRRWIITLIVIPLAVGLALVLKYWPRTLDDGECSALYRSYLGRTGIRSTFIKGKSLRRHPARIPHVCRIANT